MCSPPRGWAALPRVGQEGRYIMLEVKSFVISAISLDATINDSVKQVEGHIGARDYDAIVGILPNGNLIGRLTTYRYDEEIREVIFVITKDGEVESVGYSPAGKCRALVERELNFIVSTCLDYGYPICHPTSIKAYRKFKYINLDKVLSE